MAAESLVLRTLKEQVTCPVCLEDYKDPKVLECLHVYCTGCLEKLLLRSSQAGSLTCPNCRKVTQIPPNGVAGLEKAFYINRLFDISAEVIPLPEKEATVTGGSGVVVPSKDPKVTCPEHRKNELTLFCETCRKVICLECTIQVHNRHTYHLLKDVVEKEKALVRPMVDTLNAPIEALRKGLEEAERRKMDVVDLQATIEGTIHCVIMDLHNMLEERESSIISQLNHITKVKLKELELEVNEKETLQAKICSCSRNAQEALANENTIEFMTKSADLERDLRKALKEYEGQLNVANVCTQADMVLDLPLDFKQRWIGFGQIMTPSSLDLQMCVAKGKGHNSSDNSDDGNSNDDDGDEKVGACKFECICGNEYTVICRNSKVDTVHCYECGRINNPLYIHKKAAHNCSRCNGLGNCPNLGEAEMIPHLEYLADSQSESYSIILVKVNT